MEIMKKIQEWNISEREFYYLYPIIVTFAISRRKCNNDYGTEMVENNSEVEIEIIVCWFYHMSTLVGLFNAEFGHIFSFFKQLYDFK